MKRRLLVIGMAVMVVASVLAACGAAPASTPTAEPTVASAPMIPFESGGGGAAIQEKKSLPDLVRGADRIVVATVTSAESAWNADHTAIFTTVRLRVDEMVKGAQASEITLVVEGGQVGEIAQSSADGLSLSGGEEVVLFLSGQSVVGGQQGALPVTDGKVGDQPLSAFLDQVRAAE
jgi:molybdopterin-binding protein